MDRPEGRPETAGCLLCADGLWPSSFLAVQEMMAVVTRRCPLLLSPSAARANIARAAAANADGRTAEIVKKSRVIICNSGAAAAAAGPDRTRGRRSTAVVPGWTEGPRRPSVRPWGRTNEEEEEERRGA